MFLGSIPASTLRKVISTFSLESEANAPMGVGNNLRTSWSKQWFPKEINLASFVLLPLSFLLDFHDTEKPLLLSGPELGFLPLGFQLSDAFIL